MTWDNKRVDFSQILDKPPDLSSLFMKFPLFLYWWNACVTKWPGWYQDTLLL